VPDCWPAMRGSIELVLGQILRSRVPGEQRHAQLHNQDAGRRWRQSGLVIEDVGQDSVGAPVEIAAGAVAGILDADALLQLFLTSVPWAACRRPRDDEGGRHQ